MPVSAALCDGVYFCWRRIHQWHGCLWVLVPHKVLPATAFRLDRVWRVKSKHSVCAIASYDLDGDGLPELISGWSNGRVCRWWVSALGGRVASRIAV